MLDRLLALLLLVVLSPVMVLIAFLIRIESPGAPLHIQERVGKDGRRFAFCKFRTMQVDNDDSEHREYVAKLIAGDAAYTVDPQGNPIYKIVDDPRLTRLGAFLRKTALDELPQLLNVLKGEMSLVGPRPDLPFAVEMYKDWHLKRLCVTPGMTGLWQVSGANRLSFSEMVRLDIEYAEEQSLWLDLKIAFGTVRMLFGRKRPM